MSIETYWKSFKAHIILSLAVIALFFSSCNNDEKTISQMCEELYKHYPVATLQDIYKTCYQDFFGAEHLMSNTAAARQYLHRELEECRDTDMTALPRKEPTGFRHRFTRINLACVVDGEITEEQLLALFIEAAGKDNTFGADWLSEWKQIERIALQVNPQWADPELQAKLLQAAQEKQAVRHSDAFRNTYNPHYRIVKTR